MAELTAEAVKEIVIEVVNASAKDLHESLRKDLGESLRKEMNAGFKRQRKWMEDRFEHQTNVTFRYLDKRFKPIEDRLNDLGDKFSNLQSSADGFAKQYEKLDHESQSATNKFNRHGRQLEALARNAGVALPD